MKNRYDYHGWQRNRLGYFEEFPDYLTQGETNEDLQDGIAEQALVSL